MNRWLSCQKRVKDVAYLCYFSYIRKYVGEKIVDAWNLKFKDATDFARLVGVEACYKRGYFICEFATALKVD